MVKSHVNVRIPATVKRFLEQQAEREGIPLVEYVRKNFGLLAASGTIKIIGDKDLVEVKAGEHAQWFVDIITPMIKSTAETFFVHGHKHGVEDGVKLEQSRVLDKIKGFPKEMAREEKKDGSKTN